MGKVLLGANLFGELEKPLTRSRALDQIEEIYQAFPRHVGKKAAHLSIKKALLKISAGALLEKVKLYANSPKVAGLMRSGQRDKIPHPTTWFNQERWVDDIIEWGYRGMKNKSTIAQRNADLAERQRIADEEYRRAYIERHRQSLQASQPQPKRRPGKNAREMR